MTTLLILAAWTQLAFTGGPCARATTGVAAFDSLLIVDGWTCATSASCEYLSETWSYTYGLGWQRRGEGLQSKAPLIYSALAPYPWDPFGMRVLQQGGKACFPCTPADRSESWWWFLDEGAPAGRWEQGPRGECGLDLEQHSMVYDPVRQTIVLYGGYDGKRLYGDIWELDTTGSLWEHSSLPSTPGPGARCGHSAVWAPALQAMLIYGGERGGQYLGDSWVYERYLGARMRWRRGPISPAGMSGRAMAGMTVDVRTGNVLLFGGLAGPPPWLSDTWLLTGNAWQRQVTPIHPSWRAGPAMAGTSQGVLLFGGQRAMGETMGDLWIWR